MPRWPDKPKFSDAKYCMRCETAKPLTEFASDKDRHDGRFHSCKECVRRYMSYRWQNNSEHRAKQQVRSRKYYETPESRARVMVANAKRRRPDGFTLTVEHVLDGINAGICPVTGIAFDMTNEHEKLTGRSRNPYSPLLDRIDSRLPYTNENCRIVCTQFNTMKGELSDAEILYLCRLIASRHLQ